MSHTPGPWKARCFDVHGTRPLGDDGVRYWEVEPVSSGDDYRGGVASVHAAVHIGGISIAERDANAALIASAPDLLEALSALYDRRTAETMAKAREAMAKAEGNS
jgi:hypothetical protein